MNLDIFSYTAEHPVLGASRPAALRALAGVGGLIWHLSLGRAPSRVDGALPARGEWMRLLVCPEHLEAGVLLNTMGCELHSESHLNIVSRTSSPGGRPVCSSVGTPLGRWSRLPLVPWPGPNPRRRVPPCVLGMAAAARAS